MNFNFDSEAVELLVGNDIVLKGRLNALKSRYPENTLKANLIFIFDNYILPDKFMLYMYTQHSKRIEAI